MDKFELAGMIKTARPVNREAFIADMCSGKTVLDMGCIRHNAEFALKDATWLHKRISTTSINIM